MTPAPFIVGAGRSGNTMLRLMLDAHPDLAIPPETDFLPEVAAATRSEPDPREAFLGTILRHWRCTDCHVDAALLRAAVHRLDPFDFSEAVRSFYRLYAARFGKSRWGDKTPYYLWHMASIQEFLPEARFIHVIRDGRDAALSIRDLWFGPNSIEEAALWWKRSIEHARRQASQLDHYMEIRYEDLIRETEPALRRICRFIALPWSPAILAFHERARQRIEEVISDFRDGEGNVIATVEQRHAIHCMTQRPPTGSRIGRWRTEMCRADREHFKQVAGALLAELGYDVA